MARQPAAQEFEALPEADRLGNFPHPRETTVIHGLDAPARALADAFGDGRMHHGWLLCGPRGIGKATLAYQFARYAFARPDQRGGDDMLGGGFALDVDPASSAARQVTALSHPGLLLLRRPYDPKEKRFKTAITVDEVRRLRSFLGHTAEEDAWRVVIVDAVDEANIAAANALLKSLEEPPPRTVFLLISAEPGRLLATIRSRCRKLDIPGLDDASLRSAATAAITAAGGEVPADAAWPRLLELSHGSVRRLIGLSTADGLKLADWIEDLLGGLPRLDRMKVHQLADELAPAAAEQRFNAFLDLLLEAMADVAREATLGGPAHGSSKTAGRARLAARLTGAGSLATWAALWETVVRERADAQLLNLDRKALILGTMARLEGATRSL